MTTEDRELQHRGREVYGTPSLTVYGNVADLTEKPPNGNDGSGKSFSDVYHKENFGKLDPVDVLDRVASLQITTWNYRDQPSGVRHIGPMAQDFAAAFGVGEDDRHIHAVDSAGVALAAIQALYGLVRERDAELASLRAEVADLRAKVDGGSVDRLN